MKENSGIDIDSIEELLAMSCDEQQKWLIDVLEFVKENNLEQQFLSTVENVFDDLLKTM